MFLYIKGEFGFGTEMEMWVNIDDIESIEPRSDYLLISKKGTTTYHNQLHVKVDNPKEISQKILEENIKGTKLAVIKNGKLEVIIP